MAKLLKGLLGPISGKVGNMVFVTRDNKCYVKAVPAPSSKPASARQMEARIRFGMAMRFALLLKPLIQTSLKSHKRVVTGMNALVKDILQNTLTNDVIPKIDYSKVILSRGRLGQPGCIQVRAQKNGLIRFDWSAHNNFDTSSDDELLIVLYQEATQQCWFDLHTRVTRRDETCTIDLPDKLSRIETQVWVAFRSSQLGIFSMSQYLGTLYNTKKKRS